MLTLLYAALVTSAGSGATTLSVAAVSGNGVMRIAGAASESLGVDTTAAAGNERILGTGSESVTVAASSASGKERFAGSGTESFGVATTSSSGKESLAGSGSESPGVFTGSGNGTERIAGTGTESFGGPSLFGSSSNNQQGNGSVTVDVPAINGSGSQQGAVVPGEPPQSQGGGGGSDGFVRWVPLPRKAPAIPIPAKQVRIAGRGQSSARVPSLQATGGISLRGGTGDVQVRIELVGDGSHTRPKVMGAAAMMFGAIQVQSLGFHDIRPVEEEELALLLAA